jgi:nicotinamide-nucleotide amidase
MDVRMTAVVLAVGSELLRPGRRDTNGEWLIGRLLDLGIETRWRSAVDDDVVRIARLIRAAWEDAGVILLTGGLGPTEDDRTREALAYAFEAPLTRDPVMTRWITSMFSARGRVAGPRQWRQADRPLGAAWIDNTLGSAPGLLIERDGRMLAALPGVPAEMKAMFDASLAPRLAALHGGALARTTLRIAGRPESWVDELVRDLYGTSGTETTILASPGSVELLVTARGADATEAQARLSGLTDAMRARLGIDLYGVDGDTIASVVGRLLVARDATVAVAESCTAGLLGAALTEVPGSSTWFRGGVVCYADDLKTSLASVPAALIRAHGAVSEAVAKALADGARSACAADFGLGITGIAGPAGGTPEKPVGTVHIALADASACRSVKLDWPGDRELIRKRAVMVALDLLRRRLLA